jgi:outer membrane protein OmpA-like peptidoglycan-associated protein/Tol biopolymer transport system component/Tfp pilus assembly protein PilF
MGNRIVAFLWICTPLHLMAQTYTTAKTATGHAKTAYDAGRKAAFADQMTKAIPLFEAAVKAAPDFIEAHFQLGGAFMEMGKLEKAIFHFKKVSSLDAKYQPNAFYGAGQCEMQLEKYGDAVQSLGQFLKMPNIHPDLARKARLAYQNAQFIPNALKNPVSFHPKSLDTNVNTKHSEYLPALTADGETLIYTSLLPMGRLMQEDFYISKKKDSIWQKGVELTALNTDDNEGAHCISADGRVLIFTGCNRSDALGSCDLYISILTNGEWSKPKNMGSNVNSSSWEGQPSLSADGQALYFSSERAGGRGGKDIWVSHRNTKGYWAAPEVLDSLVNTAWDEQTPFMHPDAQTLYFTSDGHPGMGGNDLFLTRKDSLGHWAMPKNLGYPINTKSYEAALTVSLDGKTAYFSKNIASAHTKNNYDIFSFELDPSIRPLPVTYVRATVRNANTKEPLSAKLELTDLANNRICGTGRTNEKGYFLICLPYGKKYALNVLKDQFLFQSEHFNLTEIRSADKPFELEIFLVPIPTTVAAAPSDPNSANPPATTVPSVGQSVILKNVFFETGLATLRSESHFELNRLKEMLLANPTLKIQIQGHTDNVGSAASNQTLSEQRAKVVYNYLIQQGIPSNRLTFKGFGASQPVADNQTEDGKRQNRRTAFMVF